MLLDKALHRLSAQDKCLMGIYWFDFFKLDHFVSNSDSSIISVCNFTDWDMHSHVLIQDLLLGYRVTLVSKSNFSKYF